MATKAIRRKVNTARRAAARGAVALVHNPSRGLSIGGRPKVRRAATVNPRRRRRKYRRNPISAVANPRRRRRVARRRNPASITGLFMGALMTAAGVTLFDLAVTRFAPDQNGLIPRVGVKLAGAWIFQNYGRRIPLIGKHSNEVALVLMTLGFADLLRAYALPPINQALSNFTGGSFQLYPAPAQIGAGDGTTGNLYGNARVNWAPSRFAA